MKKLATGLGVRSFNEMAATGGALTRRRMGKILICEQDSTVQRPDSTRNQLGIHANQLSLGHSSFNSNKSQFLAHRFHISEVSHD
jgi:hypothetical protein